MCNFSGMPRTVECDQAEEHECECNPVDFANQVAAKIPSKWQTFGIGLGIDMEILERVAAKNYGQQVLYFAKVYSIWKSENRKPVTWAVVVEVLESNLLQERALAYELRQKYHIA